VKLHTKLFVALVAGIALGAALHSQSDSVWITAINANLLRPIGQIFLRSIFMIVVPMVFSALVIGVYDLGRGHDLSGVAGRTLWFTVVLSTLSVAVGILLVNLLRPGDNVALQQAVAAQPASAVQALLANAAARKSVADTIIELVPRNPLDSAVRALDGEMLPLMVFALVFGVAVSRTAPRDGQQNVLMRFLEQVFDACMTIVHFAMQLAPFAVFAIIFNTAFTFGTAVFTTLFFYVATVVAALLVHQFGVYALLLRLWRRSPIDFFRQCRDVFLCVLDRCPARRCHCRWKRLRRSSRFRIAGSSDRRRHREPERHRALPRGLPCCSCADTGSSSRWERVGSC
jgi:DAACS family dicarboxylate/amino acid:cation (Na+ or H+) symporter